MDNKPPLDYIQSALADYLHKPLSVVQWDSAQENVTRHLAHATGLWKWVEDILFLEVRLVHGLGDRMVWVEEKCIDVLGEIE